MNNQCMNQQMHLIKYSSWQVSNCYMFRHRGAILRELQNRGVQIQHANLDIASS
jgi:hypothetical protein